MINAIHQSCIHIALGGLREQNLPGATGDMELCRLSILESTTAFHNQIYIHFRPRQLADVRFIENTYLIAVY